MKNWFSKLAKITSKLSGHPIAFIGALLLIVVWLVTGPIFGWSDSHSLFINTVTTIITFLMVFLIQNSQNKDTAALHIKLDDLIKAIDKADNYLIKIEDGDEDQLEEIIEKFKEETDKNNI